MPVNRQITISGYQGGNFTAVKLPRSTLQITLQPVLMNTSKFLKGTHRTKISKIDIPRSVVVEALSW